MKFLNAVILMLIAVVLGFLMARGWMQAMMREAQPLPVINEIGAFELTDQTGEPARKEDLLGKVWIANFIFTRCGGPCPRMTQQLGGIQKSLAHEDLRLVSFTVDPEYDRPEVLARYADRFGAGPRWLFLTGDKKTVHDLSLQHFLLGVSEVPPEERTQHGHHILHSTKFVLLDRGGRIRGYYDSLDNESLDRLKQDANRLLQGKGGA